MDTAADSAACRIRLPTSQEVNTRVQLLLSRVLPAQHICWDGLRLLPGAQNRAYRPRWLFPWSEVRSTRPEFAQVQFLPAGIARVYAGQAAAEFAQMRALPRWAGAAALEVSFSDRRSYIGSAGTRSRWSTLV
jgi:hypothetical protein